jgi:integrase
MSVYKREDSQFYWYKFKFKGKVYRESTGKTSRRKAEADEEDRKAQVRRIWMGLEEEKPKTPPPPIPLFSTYAAQWLDVYVKVNCKRGTYDLRKNIIDYHLEPAFGKKRLDAITRQMVEAFIAEKIDAKLKKGTVRNLVSVLQAILSHAVRNDLLDKNRAAGLGRFNRETSLKAGRKHVVPLTHAETQILLTAARAKSLQLYVFCLTGLLAGLRISELIGLQWGDIDRVNKKIHISRAITQRRMETPKSHMLRDVDLADELLAAFDDLSAQRKTEWLKKGKPAPEWVFCDEDGNFLEEFTFRKNTFYRLLTSAKLRKFRIHDLRHTFASMHLQQRAQIKWIQLQMGHHSINVTLDIYGHLMPDDERSAANRLGALLVPAKAAEVSA